MSKEKWTPFKIIPGTIVKGTGEGYMVCQTEPVHPHSLKLPDRKARYVYVHRVKMENHLGRFLTKEEAAQIDHKDKDKTNNSISNLKLTTLGEHQKDHASRGNHFWKDSPYTKKGTPHKKKSKKKEASSYNIPKVVRLYLQSYITSEIV